MNYAAQPMPIISSSLAVFGILIFTRGCETLDEKFLGKEHEEIGPFAQKTVEALAVQNIQIRDNELI